MGLFLRRAHLIPPASKDSNHPPESAVARPPVILRAWRLIEGPHLLSGAALALAALCLARGILALTNGGAAPGALARWARSPQILRGLLGFGAAVLLLRVAALLHPEWSPLPPQALEELSFSWEGDNPAPQERIASALDRAGLTIAQRVESSGRVHICAVDELKRRLWRAAFYAGLCLLLLAALLRATLGPSAFWKAEPVDLCVGEETTFKAPKPLTVRLERLSYHHDAHGELDWYASTLRVQESGALEKELTLRPHSGAAYAGLRVYQTGYGPAARVRLWEQGSPITLYVPDDPAQPQAAARLRFDQQRQEQMLAAPEAGLVLRLTYHPADVPSSREGTPLQLKVLRASDGEALHEAWIDGDDNLALDGFEIEVSPEYYVTVGATRDRLLWLAILGGALTLAGLAGHLYAPERKVWLAAPAAGERRACHLGTASRWRDAAWLAELRASLQARKGSS